MQNKEFAECCMSEFECGLSCRGLRDCMFHQDGSSDVNRVALLAKPQAQVDVFVVEKDPRIKSWAA